MYSMGKHLVGGNILTVQIKGNIIFIYSHVHLPEIISAISYGNLKWTRSSIEINPPRLSIGWNLKPTRTTRLRERTRCKQDEHRRNMDPVDFKTFVHSSSHDTDKKTRVARRVLYITHINKSKHLLWTTFKISFPLKKESIFQKSMLVTRIRWLVFR